MHSGGEQPCRAAHFVVSRSARCLVWMDGEKWASEGPTGFHCSSEAFPHSTAPASPQQLPPRSGQPTSAVQGVPRVCSASGRTCLGPAGDDAEPWQGEGSRGLVGWASLSPHILPVLEAHRGQSRIWKWMGWGRGCWGGEINHHFVTSLMGYGQMRKHFS